MVGLQCAIEKLWWVVTVKKLWVLRFGGVFIAIGVQFNFSTRVCVPSFQCVMEKFWLAIKSQKLWVALVASAIRLGSWCGGVPFSFFLFLI